MAEAQESSGMRLRVVFYQDDGDWYGHCLELDLVESGATREEAKASVLDVIRAHVEWAIQHENMEHLYRSAPMEFWTRFFGGIPIGTEVIHISVPSSDSIIPSAWQLEQVTATRDGA
jgi:predicted RNase H-like HicB family nuclease